MGSVAVERDARGSGRRNRWIPGLLVASVACLAISICLQWLTAGADGPPVWFRFGLWGMAWAAWTWFAGTVAAGILLGRGLWWLLGWIRPAWLETVLSFVAYLLFVVLLLGSFAYAALLGFLALLDHPTGITAPDGQRVFVQLDYEGGIYAARVRESMFLYRSEPVPGSPDPAHCLLEAEGARLELRCGDQLTVLRQR